MIPTGATFLLLGAYYLEANRQLANSFDFEYAATEILQAVLNPFIVWHVWQICSVFGLLDFSLEMG